MAKRRNASCGLCLPQQTQDRGDPNNFAGHLREQKQKEMSGQSLAA